MSLLSQDVINSHTFRAVIVAQQDMNDDQITQAILSMSDDPAIGKVNLECFVCVNEMETKEALRLYYILLDCAQLGQRPGLMVLYWNQDKIQSPDKRLEEMLEAFDGLVISHTSEHLIGGYITHTPEWFTIEGSVQ